MKLLITLRCYILTQNRVEITLSNELYKYDSLSQFTLRQTVFVFFQFQ